MWKLVPETPTKAMIDAAYDAHDKADNWAGLRSAFKAALSASPDPTTDEALVERVARAIWDNAPIFFKPEWSALEPVERAIYRNTALAAIRAMEEKP